MRYATSSCFNLKANTRQFFCSWIPSFPGNTQLNIIWKNAKLLLDQPRVFSASLPMGLHGREGRMRNALCCNTTELDSNLHQEKTDVTNPFETNWETTHDSDSGLLRPHTWITIEEALKIPQSMILKYFLSRGHTWPIGGSQIQRKVCSLFGYFANFIPKSEPYNLYKSQDVFMEGTFL